MLLALSFLVVLGVSQYSSDESSANPDGTYVGGGATYELYDTDAGYTATASWDGTTAEVTIEAVVVQNEKTYFVDTLTPFAENSVVTKVVIKSNSHLTMGVSTFYNNHALTTIELGEDIKEIPASFCAVSDSLNGSNLTTINLENVETIGDNAFQKCSKLIALDLSRTENIGAYAFDECTALTGVTLSSQLETIGNYAFQRCTSLQSITIPGSILSPGTGAFNVCIALEEIILDQNFKSIGEHMFENCTSLKSIDLKNVQGIGAMAFRFCTALESITIPDTTKAIDTMAFDGCTALTSCNLGSGLERLGSQVFQNCPISGKMTVPASLTSISVMQGGMPTFPVSLSEIEVDPANSVYASKDGLLYDKAMTTVLYCPGAKTGEVTIAASVEEYAFANCHLSKVIILDGAETIGIAAFSVSNGDPTLEEIVFPHSLTSIGNNIVGNQTKLKAVILPSELNSLGARVFQYLPNLEYVVFPDTDFTTPAKFAFAGKTFHLANGNTVPANKANEVIGSLHGARFVWNGVDAGHLYQIDDTKVLLTKVINGEKVYEAISKDSVCVIESPEAPEHMMFDGWYNNSEFTESYDVSANVTADVVVYAKFSLETHTITYKLDGEDVGEVETYEYGKLVSVRETYEKLGYTVSDWICSGAVPVEGTVTVGDEDIVFTATSAVNQYTITFDTVGGSAVDSITQDYNTAVTAPSMGPSKDGYRFVMWTPEVPASMPANDVILKAVWAIVATVNADGKSIVTLDSETSSFIPAAETKEITVEIRENTAVKVEDASDLVGKTVVSKAEPVSNSTGVSGTAYEFTFTADGTPYNGKIQVTLPYTKEDGKEPVVYYWNGSESTKMNVVSSTDASVTFETDHNSMYVVASETPSKDDGLSFLLFFGLLMVVGIAVSMLVGFNFYRKKA